jgi:uncharacterized protein YvpB
MPKEVRLNIPYKSQRDNKFNPGGSCNVTSVAMCLSYLGVTPQRKGIQLEDELYAYMQGKRLDRHNPQDLAIAIRDYGKKDDFTFKGTIVRCQGHLDNGNPCVVHGWFTNSGHIIALVGYDERGFIVHDPWGEYWDNGYDTGASGAFLHYSYGLIKETCMTDGEFWVHYITA